MNTIKLLSNLVKTPSPSGEEQAIVEKISVLLDKDFKIKKQLIKNNRYNLYAYRGKPEIILTTHTDTVRPQIKYYETKNTIAGRGACDSKGSIVAMIAAAINAADKGYTNFGLIFDVDEENLFERIIQAVKLVKAKRVIIGEPTGLKIVRSQKGLLGMRIIAKGRTAHGSNPNKGKNAITILLKTLNDVQKICLDSDNNWNTTLNIGTINAGIAPNIIPDNAVAQIEFRTIRKNDLLIKRIRKIVEKYDAKIEIFENFNPVVQKNGTCVSYFTEMYFWAKKSDCIVYGPGSIAYAHASNEFVKKIDVLKAQRYYFKEIVKYAKLQQTI